MRAVFAVVLLFAPDGAVELKYRFVKGMSYTDAQVRDYRLEAFQRGRTFKWDITSTYTLKRTILGVDGTAHPTIERVEVLRFRRLVRASPKADEVGTETAPCEGKTFVWKRLEKRWGLFDEKGEVTKEHFHLVEQLKNWRDARLPERPLPVGESWTVPPERFLETAGLEVPKGVEGIALFRLEKLERGIATIPFKFSYNFKGDEGALVSVVQKGTWTFDAGRGRDLSFFMTGTLEFNKGRSGAGSLKMTRRVTYSG